MREELDAPSEWYYDGLDLTVWFNDTIGPGPIEVVVHSTLINVTGAHDITLSGVGFRDTDLMYFEPHGMPSGGDWAVHRGAALFFQDSSSIVISDCEFLNIDGNAIFLSGGMRNASVVRSSFRGIGETAILQWGFTDGSPVPGMGYDGRAGRQPLGTQILYNWVRDVGNVNPNYRNIKPL